MRERHCVADKRVADDNPAGFDLILPAARSSYRVEVMVDIRCCLLEIRDHATRLLALIAFDQ